jgi:anti-sigma-K factor RskA
VTDPTPISPDDSALAAEYALGLLSADEMRGFEARLAVEPALRAEVAVWQAQFAGMAEAEVDPVAPPAALKARIEADLFPEAVPSSIWDRIGLWRVLGLGGLASTAALVALLLLTPPAPQPAPLVADLAPLTGEAQFVAVFDPSDNTLRLRQSAGSPRAGRVQEVWLIVGEAAPVSLGLFDADGRFAAVVPEALSPLLSGAVLAVSDEPPGGSPTGAPTGDVLAAGPVVEI